MRLESLPPTFTTKAARECGIHSRDISRWRDVGDIVELSRGVFRKAGAPQPTYPDLLAVATRAPRAIICCLSAAAAYDLTDERTPSVQIAVSAAINAPKIDYPPTTVMRFAPTEFELGLAMIEAAPGESIRIYDPARTVVDMIRLRSRFGEPVAYNILHRYLAAPKARPAKLLNYARSLHVFGPVRAALDIVSSR